jgi:hypothetical protein
MPKLLTSVDRTCVPDWLAARLRPTYMCGCRQSYFTLVGLHARWKVTRARFHWCSPARARSCGCRQPIRKNMYVNRSKHRDDTMGFKLPVGRVFSVHKGANFLKPTKEWIETTLFSADRASHLNDLWRSIMKTFHFLCSTLHALLGLVRLSLSHMY